jgi:hypothetical protein
MNKLLITMLLLCPFIGLSQPLTNGTNISITKIWPQQPNGYTYPMGVFVPGGAVPQGGFPVCILLHGNGGNGPAMIGQTINTGTLLCHILVAPTGYLNSWNICAENSDAPDVNMVNDLVNILQGYSNVNPNKIRILGASNGAGLANRVFIENNNAGIDIVCATVSHLNEPQYHSGSFYKPSGTTDPNSSFCGYNTVDTPLTTRKYLGMSNDNDPIIPYLGGTSVVGVNFLPAETAAFNIAVYKGYAGSILTSGVSMGNPVITEYSYLSGNVVHIKSNAMHTINATHRAYIKNYFEDCAPVLPITYSKPLEAVCKNKETRLTWSISAQINNDKYIIEHSQDGRAFSSIGEIIGNGTDSEERHYSYTHDTPYIGINYYRIKQVDLDGQYTYGNIATVVYYGDGKEIAIYPNPATDEVIIGVSEDTEVIVVDMMGRVVKKDLVNKENNRISIGNLPKGIFYVGMNNQKMKLLKL